MAPERTGLADSRSATRSNPADGSSGDAPPSAQQPVRPVDDDLTNLTWLQDSNLLQSIRPNGALGTRDAGARVGAARDGGGGSETGGDTTDCSSEEGVVHEGGAGAGSTSETYDPAVHVHAKPPYSFSSLIFMAVEDSPSRALPVKEIYSWILAHFPYFQNAPTGWKNSVRHNLSLNKCFLKVDKGQNVAKGSLWCIDPEYRPNLLMALRKTPPNPFHPIRLPEDIPTPPSSLSAFCLTMCAPAHKASSPVTPVSSSVGNLPNPDLFPYLSKRLAASATKDLEVDAAATMLALKNAPRILSVPSVIAAPVEAACRRIMSTTKERRQKRVHNRTTVLSCYPSLVPTVYVPVITVSPSEDHTYSSTSSPQHSDSPGSSIDEPFEFDQRHGSVQHLPDGGEIEIGGAVDSGGDSGVTRSSSGGGGGSTGDEMEELPYDDEDSDGDSLEADDEAEEQKKIVEGADALLNLAGIRTERGALEQHHQHQLSRTTRDRRKLGRHLIRHSRLEHVVQR